MDIDPQDNPTLCKDILHVARSNLPEHVAAVWASPLCTESSIGRTRANTPRHFVYADSLVAKAREIISWYPDVPFFIENPQGLLKHRAVIQGIPIYTVDYCQYKDERWPQLYRQRTNLWTNCLFHPCPLCDKKTCGCCFNGKHMAIAQKWYTNTDGTRMRNSTSQVLYTIPPRLLEDVFGCVLASPLQSPT